jgi:hypothetical protein
MKFYFLSLLCVLCDLCGKKSSSWFFALQDVNLLILNDYY